MNILYVIGNGFDRWHGLPTSYSDFYKFTEGALNELEEYFNFQYSGESLWTNFEGDLGKFDWSLFYDAHNHTDFTSDSFRPSEVYGLEDDLTEQTTSLVDGVREKFQEWIESIQIEGVQGRFEFIGKGQFISFNYTPLLQEVYGIHDDLVLHIHGSAKKYDDLIFGHGECREEEPELDEEGNSNRTMFSDSKAVAKIPFYSLKKPVLETLGNHNEYFSALSSVDIVVVLGHSLNDIDIPYFERIAMVTEGKKWVVSKRSECDEAKYLPQLEKCGVNTDLVVFKSIEDIPETLLLL